MAVKEAGENKSLRGRGGGSPARWQRGRTRERPRRTAARSCLKTLKTERSGHATRQFTSGYRSKENEHRDWRKCISPALTDNSQGTEATSCPSAEDCVKRVWQVHHPTLSHKRRNSIATCANVDGPREHYAKWNESDRYPMISLICGI